MTTKSRRRMVALFAILLLPSAAAFLTDHRPWLTGRRRPSTPSYMAPPPLPLALSPLQAAATIVDDDDATELPPQVFTAGYSTQPHLREALAEALAMAVSQMPSNNEIEIIIDLCVFTISSLYNSDESHAVVPALRAAAAAQNRTLRHVLGGTAAGCISCSFSSGSQTTSTTTATTVELESVPAVSVILAILPDTTLRTFHIRGDLPEVGAPPAEWHRRLGVPPAINESTLFWLFPSPAFGTELDALLQGLVQNYHGDTQIMGGVASTVSSLSRARVYASSGRHDDDHGATGFGDGCVGVAMQGDIQLQSWTAQGAKPVGGIYQILQGQDSTIQVIVLDERATEALSLEEEEEATEENETDAAEPVDARAMLAQVYAKAPIPKPPLAEANFLMRTLSDDDQAFMRRQLLVGLDAGGPLGRTASELARLAAGRGHRFTVRPVAAGGMKDGSVTLALGSVQIVPGTRLRFFVREPEFARREVQALWTGYQKRRLAAQLAAADDAESPSRRTFTPGCCFIVPTLDRGSKFFAGKPGYESQTAARMLPTVPCIAGFFSNGIVGPMDGSDTQTVGIQGSASGYFLLGPRSGRPVYSAAQEARERVTDDTTTIRRRDERAPRSDDGELLWKRREVHAGRALTVSTVEWSVVEKTAQPSSVLEGYMWDKETEVDRQRERNPLSLLASQCRAEDPTLLKPRDWLGPVRQALADFGFLILPVGQRSDPAHGTLHRRYEVATLVRDWTLAGVPAISVYSDAILFGGSLEHITQARAAAERAAVADPSAGNDGVQAPRILAMDLVLYPYQLYKLRLAGADAVNILVGAMATSKDIVYLTKIAASLQLQVLCTVTSTVQIERVVESSSCAGIIVSNRQLEDFTLDDTGEQALSLLRSDALKQLREQNPQLLVLVEGGVESMVRDDALPSSFSSSYIQELKQAGADGALVSLVSTTTTTPLEQLRELQQQAVAFE